jgi:hypothetical protein
MSNLVCNWMRIKLLLPLILFPLNESCRMQSQPCGILGVQGHICKRYIMPVGSKLEYVLLRLVLLSKEGAVILFA